MELARGRWSPEKKSQRSQKASLLQTEKRAERHGFRGKKKKKKKKKTAVIFVIASFASTERKVVWNVLGNLNSPDSGGVAALIFLYRQKTPIL